MQLSENKSSSKIKPCLIIAIVSLVLCLILNIFCPSHFDINAFQNWGYDLLKYGPYQFYSHASGNPTDYPPVYLLLCGLMAVLCNLFHANFIWQRFFFRLPSVLIFFVSVFVFNKLIRHFVKSEKLISVLTFFFAFAPASIANVIWGQCDCFTMFYILLACLMFVNKKYLLTLLVCTVGLLTKTQFLFVIPVFGFAVLWRLIREKKLMLLIRDVAICFIVYFIIFLPFLMEKMVQGQPLYLFQILFEQVGHFNTFSSNALNLYTGLNLNFVAYPNWYSYVNFAILIAIVVVSCFIIIKNDSDLNVVLLSSFILTAIFMLSTNMHERYMLGALGTMMIAAYGFNRNLLKVSNWMFYILQFINDGLSWWFFDQTNGFKINGVAIVFSLISFVAFFIMVIDIIKLNWKMKGVGK